MIQQLKPNGQEVTAQFAPFCLSEMASMSMHTTKYS